MKNTFIKKILSSVAAVSVAVAALGTTAVPVWAFDAPQPDTGAAGGISNGGEWSIYSSRFAKIRGTFEEQTDSAGILEVTGSAGIGAAFQFDLSTKDDPTAAFFHSRIHTCGHSLPAHKPLQILPGACWPSGSAPLPENRGRHSVHESRYRFRRWRSPRPMSDRPVPRAAPTQLSLYR